MIRTRVGYSGGKKKDPTYRELGDHTETFQVDYDPARVTYARLLEIFWASHDPTARPRSRQYMAAVFTRDGEQKAEAGRSKKALEERLGREVRTPILPAGRFYPAEGYHQKYFLRNRGDLLRIVRSLFPDEKAFVGSTAAARLNGLLGGHGTLQGVLTAFRREGLTEEHAAQLERILAPGGKKRSAAPCGS